MPYLSLTQKSFFYASKTLIGAVLCWQILSAFGVSNPIWSLITVVLVSDPDLTTAKTLVKARVINTIVGCSIGLASMLLFGYSLPIGIGAAALTVLLITSIDHYPTNWRLAPATVLILMDAGKNAATHQEELHYAFLRAAEIAVGCVVALALSHVYTRFARRMQRAEGQQTE